ncbi:hypothetical protein PPROV_001084800 [Pycnococcus provasolii]|uniref:Sfi1 spindle body domain-containing protein n=1 Tax=Pycnococcus provasolii TaxID=41880 RepID=A0A830I2Z6_9CHLO|nr:hypothetical protein PPROV_001084800 [Pycnococcus provasolii]
MHGPWGTDDDRWVESVKEANEAAAEEARREAIVEKTLRKMFNAKMHTAFETWKAQWLQMNRLRGMIHRMQNRELSQAFTHWVDVWWHIKRAREEEEERREQEREAEERREVLMRRIGNRIANRVIAMAFERWSDQVREIVEMRTLLTRAAKKMQMREISKAFDRWCEYTTEIVEIRTKLERAARKIMGRNLVAAWAKWMDYTIETRSMKYKLRVAAKKMLGRAMLGAWSTWHDMYREARRQRDQMKLAARKMMNRSMSMAWEKWVSLCKELNETRNKLMRVICANGASRAITDWCVRTFGEFLGSRIGHALYTYVGAVGARLANEKVTHEDGRPLSRTLSDSMYQPRHGKNARQLLKETFSNVNVLSGSVRAITTAAVHPEPADYSKYAEPFPEIPHAYVHSYRDSTTGSSKNQNDLTLAEVA